MAKLLVLTIAHSYSQVSRLRLLKGFETPMSPPPSGARFFPKNDDKKKKSYEDHCMIVVCQVHLYQQIDCNFF